jgi:hypothetical protein
MIENSKIDKVLNSDKGIPLKMEDTSAHGEYESPISTKRVHNNPKILDREMGTLRSNFSKIKNFFRNIFYYIKSFFTKKKVNEVREFFSYKKASGDHNKIHGLSPLNSTNEKNKQ